MSTVHLLLYIVSHVQAFAHTNTHTHTDSRDQFRPVTYEAWRLKTQGTNRNVRLSGRGRWEKHAARAATCSVSIHQCRTDFRAHKWRIAGFLFHLPLILSIISFTDLPSSAAVSKTSSRSGVTKQMLWVRDAHLSSLQHLPLVENLHGEDLVCVSYFYDCNLQEGQKTRKR